MTTTTNKVLPVALVAALLGGTVGAFVMRDGKKTPEVAVASEQAKVNDIKADENKTAADDQNATTTRNVVYRSTPRTRTVTRSSAPRRVYYDYGQRSGRSFWQKHRDKLTVAMGAGGGALLGGLIGGKKGAGIGALAGGGGSALWTYKLRKRNRNY